MIRRKKSAAAAADDVVRSLQERVRQAQALAAVPEQGLLSNPRLNPATRQVADELAAERLRAALDAEHRRVLRAQRARDRREEEAVRAAAAVADARAATDPALTVLAVVRGRRRYTALCLTASLVLSVGSAMGLEAAVSSYYPTAPTGIGYLAEIALTGLSTAAIVWASLLARAGAHLAGALRGALGALVALPLAASVVGSTLGSGPVGAVASLGSAAFALLAWLVATTSATAVAGLLARLDDRRTTEPVPVDVDPAGLVDVGRADGLDVVGEAIADEAASYLRALPDRDRTGDHTEVDPCDRGGDQTGSVLVAPSDRTSDRTGDPETETESAQAREIAAQRRAEGARNRDRVRDYLTANPGATTREIAAATGLAESTVRRIRRELRTEEA